MKYNVTGMNCAACSSRVEKAVRKVEGITDCSVSLLTNSMEVKGNANAEAVIAAVTSAGYGASVFGKKTEKETKKNNHFRLVASIVLVLLLMYVAMGHDMFHFPLPPFFENNPLSIGLLQLLISTAVLVINQKMFVDGFKGIKNGGFNMFTLVSMGSGISYFYSVYLLFRMTLGEDHLHSLYFESAAMILALINVGKTMEEYSKGKTTSAINALIALKPETATLLIEDKEVKTPIDKVKIGDIFIVKPGESIPCDGVVLDGESAVDEAALTGESIPVDKTVNDLVYAATLNSSGYLKCRVTQRNDETSLAKIIKIVTDASAGKAPIQKLADKVSGIFVPTVIFIAVITFIVWAFVDIGSALEHAISVLVISCPCALGIATPVAIMVGNGVGAKNGILFKSATALEETGRIKNVVLDKTGTITKGKPIVTDIIGNDPDFLLKVAYSIERKSEHPLAKAVVEAAQAGNVEYFETENFTIHSGAGVSAIYNGIKVSGGNSKLVTSIGEKDKDTVKSLSQAGKTPLLFEYDGRFLGIIAVADEIKEDSIYAVSALKKMGIGVTMLTGDNQITAKAIADKVGIENFKAAVMPEDKVEFINSLKTNGKVMMVGDGINDAPALTVSDVGVAIGAGCDIAIESADVVLMNSGLLDAVNALKLGKSVLRNIKQNLFWAFFYNCLGIPLAAGVFISAFGWKLNPMLCAAAMSVSSLFVVINALRLNLIKFSNNKEKTKMKKVIKIGGMMCGHCEARVKKLLEAFPQVENADVSYKNGKAVLTLSAEISDAEIKKAVEDEGYTFG